MMDQQIFCWRFLNIAVSQASIYDEFVTDNFSESNQRFIFFSWSSYSVQPWEKRVISFQIG